MVTDRIRLASPDNRTNMMCLDWNSVQRLDTEVTDTLDPGPFGWGSNSQPVDDTLAQHAWESGHSPIINKADDQLTLGK